MNLDDLKTVLRILEHPSLKKAARATGETRASLARALDRLEADLGVALVERHPRGITPTGAGLRLVEHGAGVLLGARDLRRRVLETSDGTVLRTMSFLGIPTPLVAALVSQTLESTRLEVSFSEDPLSHLSEPYDAFVHFGPPPAIGPLYSRVLLRAPLGLFASPAYLAAHGTPECVADLAGHRLLHWRHAHGTPGRWPLRDGGFVEVEPALETPDIYLLHCLMGQGAGIGLMPRGPFPDPPGVGPTVPVLADQVGADDALRVLLRDPTRVTPHVGPLVERIVDLPSSAE